MEDGKKIRAGRTSWRSLKGAQGGYLCKKKGEKSCNILGHRKGVLGWGKYAGLRRVEKHPTGPAQRVVNGIGDKNAKSVATGKPPSPCLLDQKGRMKPRQPEKDHRRPGFSGRSTVGGGFKGKELDIRANNPTLEEEQ